MSDRPPFRDVARTMWANVWLRLLVFLTPAALIAQFAGIRDGLDLTVSAVFVLGCVAVTLWNAHSAAVAEIDRDQRERQRTARLYAQIREYNDAHPDQPFAA
jgi:hypothetical protein